MPIKKSILGYILSEGKDDSAIDQAIINHFQKLATDEREKSGGFSIQKWIGEASENIYEYGIVGEGPTDDSEVNQVEGDIARWFMEEYDNPDFYEEEDIDIDGNLDFHAMREEILSDEGRREFRGYAISMLKKMLWNHPLTDVLKKHMGKGGLTLYREIVLDKDELVRKLSFYDGIGIYFAFDKEGAESYNWGAGGIAVDVLMECFVPLSSIDWETTANVGLWGFNSEMEVRVFKGDVVYLNRIEIKIRKKDGGEPTLKERDFSPPIRLKA